MTATVKANSDGSADLLVNALAAIHMASDGEVSFPQQGQSLAANGYVKLPGGLIVQWGRSVAGVVTLPTQFSGNATYSVTATALSSDAGYMFNAKIYNHVSTSFTLQAFAQAAAGGAWSSTGVEFMWIAIGY